VVSNPLDHRQRPGVAHREAFPRPAGGKERAAGSSIEGDVAENDVQLAFARGPSLPAKNQFPSAKSLAHEIVGHTLEQKLHARDGEGSERLAGNTLHLEVERSDGLMESMPHQFPSQPRAESAMLVGDGLLDGKR
jgi:hypothetical protein